MEPHDAGLSVGNFERGQQRAAFDEGEIGLQLLRAARWGLSGAGRQTHRQSVRDFVGDLILQLKDVPHLPIEPQRPQVSAGVSVQQLGRDSQALARALHAALDEIAGVELATDLARVHVVICECERGGPSDHRQAFVPGKRVQYGLSDSGREKPVTGVRAEVLER